MKKPTKKELREMSDSILLSNFAFWYGRVTVYRKAAESLPVNGSAGAWAAMNRAFGPLNVLRAEILRRMGGAK